MCNSQTTKGGGFQIALANLDAVFFTAMVYEEVDCKAVSTFVSAVSGHVL